MGHHQLHEAHVHRCHAGSAAGFEPAWPLQVLPTLADVTREATAAFDGLIENAVQITDTRYEERAMSTLSDVGDVRAGVGDRADEDALDGFVVSYSTVVNGNESGKDDRRAFLDAIEEATTAKDERVVPTISISRDNVPLNEFS